VATVKRRGQLVYTYEGRCLLGTVLLPFIHLAALFIEVQFVKEEGKWLKISVPRIEVKRAQCN